MIVLSQQGRRRRQKEERMRRDGASTTSRHPQPRERGENVLCPRGGADLVERNSIRLEVQPFRMDDLQKSLRGTVEELQRSSRGTLKELQRIFRGTPQEIWRNFRETFRESLVELQENKL